MIEKDRPIKIEGTPLSSLQTFCVKVMIVTCAALIVLFFVTSSFRSFVESQGAAMKGGPEFWQSIEAKLYKLADERDLPPEKKQKILAAVAKISVRYRPYFDALAGQPPKE